MACVNGQPMHSTSGQPGRAIIDLLTRNSRQFKSVEDCFRTGIALRHYEADANV
jgi:hypothetical protein